MVYAGCAGGKGRARRLDKGLFVGNKSYGWLWIGLVSNKFH